MTLDDYDSDDISTEQRRKLPIILIDKLPLCERYIKKEDLSTIKFHLYSEDKEQIEKSARLLRQYLTQENGQNEAQSILDLLQLNILQRIKELMGASYNNDIQLECALFIAKISCGSSNQINTIIYSGFIDTLLSLVNNPKSKLEVVSQAAWGLGNIARRSADSRQELIQRDFTITLTTILTSVFDKMYDEALINNNGKLYFSDNTNDAYYNARLMISALSNTLRGGFQVAEYFQHYLKVFHILSKFVVFENPKFEIEVCYGLSKILYYMHEVNSFHNHNVISKDLCFRLCKMLNNSDQWLVTAAVRLIVYITSGPNRDVLTLIKTPVLLNIHHLLQPGTCADIRKDAYLAVSNMAACSDEVISIIIQDNKLMKCIIDQLKVPYCRFDIAENKWTSVDANKYLLYDEWKVARETSWIVSNMISMGSEDSLWELLKDHPTLPSKLVHLLRYRDLPQDTCSKAVESTISLIQQTNKWMGVRYDHDKNPVVSSISIDGLDLLSLRCIHDSTELRNDCQKLQNLLEASHQDVDQTSVISNQESIATECDLPSTTGIISKSNKRKVI